MCTCSNTMILFYLATSNNIHLKPCAFRPTAVQTRFNSMCGNSYCVFDFHFQNRCPNCCLRLPDTRYK